MPPGPAAILGGRRRLPRQPIDRLGTLPAIRAAENLSPLDSFALTLASFRRTFVLDMWGSGSSWESGVAEVSVAGGAHQLDRAAASRVAPGNRGKWTSPRALTENGQDSGAGLVSVPQMPIPVTASSFRHLATRGHLPRSMLARGAHLAIAGSNIRREQGPAIARRHACRVPTIPRTVGSPPAHQDFLSRPTALRAAGPSSRAGLQQSLRQSRERLRRASLQRVLPE